MVTSGFEEGVVYFMDVAANLYEVRNCGEGEVTTYK